MNLEDLSNTELALLEQVRQVHGLMEDKPKMIDAIGVFDKYIDIHKWYAKLANEDNEALKRHCFYNGTQYQNLLDLQVYLADKDHSTERKNLIKKLNKKSFIL